LFDFIARIFKKPETVCTIQGYWCRTPLALDAKTAKTFGGKVTTVTALIDIDYRVEGAEVRVRGVRLSGANPNVAAVGRKEIWHADSICAEQDLAAAVTADLADREGYLWKTMMRRWRNTYGKPGEARPAHA